MVKHFAGHNEKLSDAAFVQVLDSVRARIIAFRRNNHRVHREVTFLLAGTVYIASKHNSALWKFLAIETVSEVTSGNSQGDAGGDLLEARHPGGFRPISITQIKTYRF